MIARLRGKLRELDEQTARIEVGPFWYEVLLPALVLARLPAIGDELELHTLAFIEGSAMGTVSYQRLVGFLEPVEREFFQLFTSVSGMGMKKALRALAVPVSRIAAAIEQGDERTLKQLPEIGPKTAKTLIAALQGRAGKFALLRDGVPSPATAGQVAVAGAAGLEIAAGGEAEMREEARDVLRQLHYRETEAEAMIDRALADNPALADAEALIQAIFRQHAPST